jgi:hypothetical protein
MYIIASLYKVIQLILRAGYGFMLLQQSNGSVFLSCSDSENEKSRSIEYSETVGDATVDMPQPG